ncbi:MAG TPA: hypothetical protein VHU15_00285 [Stellaceae bacterium]|jgi:hypothetical protein|nr:hypothetical protein [Stellaceae bacterium]
MNDAFAAHSAAAEDTEDDQNPIGRGAAVYLFLSVDMDNSTAFKGMDTRWPFVIHNFYEDVVREIRIVCPRFNVWKYIGDEVTFWRRIEPGDDLARLVADTHAALDRIRANLDAIEDHHHVKTRNVLSAKATIWAAAAEFVKRANLHRDLKTSYMHPNRIIIDEHILGVTEREHAGQVRIYDFIGPDIDIGFRTSHFAHRGFLLVSAGLAHALLGEAGAVSGRHMKIVSYERLKGVWNDRPYPIVWYTDDWTDTAGKFYYDEGWTNPIVERVMRGAYDDVGAITSILEQTNRLDAVAAAQDLLRGSARG